MQAVDETSELSLTTASDISGETGSGEVKRVDHTKRGSTSGSTRQTVTDEELDGVLFGVVRVEDGLVDVLEGKVKSLGREVTNDVGQITSPERANTLILDDSAETITNAVVSFVNSDVLVRVLNLEDEFDSFDRCDDCLGDSS